jgi:hypothetical protein
MPGQKLEATIRSVSAMDCHCFAAGRVAGMESLYEEKLR